ncbi:hypothetical protein KAR52_00950 [Candidatus Pacearchaeota archaeon]|nr:hypothetical protein [Candidatus Pacearchaeota archaeon]
MKAYKKHLPGETNFLTLEEENEILSALRKAHLSSSNPAIYGQNGEIPLRNYLKKHLPPMFRVETGHFITKEGILSPQIDIIIMDNRFPIINENEDGSALIPGDSVICCISIKSNTDKKELIEIVESAKKIRELTNQIFKPNSWEDCMLLGFCHTASLSFNTVCKHYFESSKQNNPHIDVTVMRKKENEKELRTGYYLHWEPGFKKDRQYIPIAIDTNSPLSDFFFQLLQNCYYTLSERKISLVNLGILTMNYFTFGTIRDEYK